MSGLSDAISSGFNAIGEGISSVKESVGGALFGPSEKSYLEENPMPEPPGEGATMDERDAYDAEYDQWLKGKEEAAARDARLKEFADKYAPDPEEDDGGKERGALAASQAPRGPNMERGPTSRFGAIQSPYKIVERGLSTTDLQKLLLDNLKARTMARVTNMARPQIRGLLG